MIENAKKKFLCGRLNTEAIFLKVFISKNCVKLP